MGIEEIIWYKEKWITREERPVKIIDSLGPPISLPLTPNNEDYNLLLIKQKINSEKIKSENIGYCLEVKKVGDRNQNTSVQYYKIEY
jgi:hypothetical protein